MLETLKRLFETAGGGESLFLRGLKDAHAGHYAKASRLFEEAAARFRKDEAVEKLARLRAHQLMVKYKTETGTIERQSILEEVVLRLSKLVEIESPSPPFAPVDAKEVLRNWMEDKTLFIGASSAENEAGIEEETILAELDLALPCELIGSCLAVEETQEMKQTN